MFAPLVVAASLPSCFHAPVFADAQKNNAVDGVLNGKVKFALRKLAVAQGNVAGKHLAPAFDFMQKCRVHFGRALLALDRIGRIYQRSL